MKPFVHSLVAIFLFILIVIFRILSTVRLDTLSPVVQTKSGPVRGKSIQLTAAGKQSVYQFTGIPFAEPPTGERRFKKPVPKSSWANVLGATEQPKICIQMAGGSEDCLYLNIWVPKPLLDAVVANRTTTQLPVYVFIHGGAFLHGYSLAKPFDGTVMSSFQNIIVCTIQYRLGSLGFAYFGKNDDAPGNAGLWDQLEALKWVSENIAAFGGNNSQITLGGQSAGGASVTFHLVSPYSRKLFHRAIVESGTALSMWALHNAEKAMALTNVVVNKSSCSRTFVADMLKCLRSLDAAAFPKLDKKISTFSFGLSLNFGSVPVIDGDFVPKHPLEMLKTGTFNKVPLLIGTAKDEGFYQTERVVTPLLSRFPGGVNNLTSSHYANLMRIGFSYPPTLNKTAFNAILLRYWPTYDGVDVLKAVYQAGGDFTFICPTYAWINAVSDIPVFAYQFTQRLSISAKPAWLGTTHGEISALAFGEPFAPYAQGFAYDNADKLLSKRALEYWGNFIKHGPRRRQQLQKWPPYVDTKCSNQTAVFDSVRLQAHCGLNADNCAFWDTIFPSVFTNINCS